MAIIPLRCPHCHGWNLSKFGKTRTGCDKVTLHYPTGNIDPRHLKISSNTLLDNEEQVSCWGKQRYACNNAECPYHTFTLEPHAYPGRRQEVKAQIVDMAINGSGVRDTARVLGVSTSTVIQELKKRRKTRECESSSVSKP